jgi:hypothetical protein
VLGPWAGRIPPRPTTESSGHPRSRSRATTVAFASASSPETKTPLATVWAARHAPTASRHVHTAHQAQQLRPRHQLSRARQSSGWGPLTPPDTLRAVARSSIWSALSSAPSGRPWAAAGALAPRRRLRSIPVPPADNARPCHPSLLSISSRRDLQMRVVLDPPGLQGPRKRGGVNEQPTPNHDH